MTTDDSTWDKIERSESYLVCCMFEESSTSSASVLKQLCDKGCSGIEYDEFSDMLESAGMVFVQSLKQLGRTSEILKELKLLFGSASVIPIQVFLTGVCFQMQEGPYDVRETLEEFLSMWRYVDDEHYTLANVEKDVGNVVGHHSPTLLRVDKYLEVVEVYVVTLLAVLQRDVDSAVSWVEKAALPEQRRQEILRQLNLMYTNKATSSSQAHSQREQSTHAGSARVFEDTNLQPIGNNVAKETIMKLSKQRAPDFSWFKTITLRFGNTRLVISSRSILLVCLLLLISYSMRRKQASLRRVLKRQVLNVKKAATDLWQLAFSYQVNPLAAVQPLPPPASHGSR